MVVELLLGASAGAASAGVGTALATAVEGVGARSGTPAVVFEDSMPAVDESGLGADAFDVVRVLGVGAPAEGVLTAGASAGVASAGAGATTVPLAVTTLGAAAGTDTDGAGAGTPVTGHSLLNKGAVLPLPVHIQTQLQLSKGNRSTSRAHDRTRRPKHQEPTKAIVCPAAGRQL